MILYHFILLYYIIFDFIIFYFIFLYCFVWHVALYLNFHSNQMSKATRKFMHHLNNFNRKELLNDLSFADSESELQIAKKTNKRDASGVKRLFDV